MEDSRAVLEGQARVFAEKEGLVFMECSAKTGTNVKELFNEVGEYSLHFGGLFLTHKQQSECQASANQYGPSPPAVPTLTPLTEATKDPSSSSLHHSTARSRTTSSRLGVLLS